MQAEEIAEIAEPPRIGNRAIVSVAQQREAPMAEVEARVGCGRMRQR